MRSSIVVLGILLLRPPHLAAQTEAETQRATLTGLRSFGVHASVQLSQGATLEPIEERVLRARVEDALRREGIVIQSPSGVQAVLRAATTMGTTKRRISADPR